MLQLDYHAVELSFAPLRLIETGCTAATIMIL